MPEAEWAEFLAGFENPTAWQIAQRKKFKDAEWIAVKKNALKAVRRASNDTIAEDEIEHYLDHASELAKFELANKLYEFNDMANSTFEFYKDEERRYDF
jgi:hypothetical protein